MLTVALLQLAPEPTDYLTRGTKACRQAAAMGADIALFPEMWNVGYKSNGTPDFWGHYRSPGQWGDDEAPDLAPVWADLAISVDSDFVRQFQALARELDMAIAVTFLEDGPRNSVALIDRHGEIVLKYSKVHTVAASPHESSLVPGDEFPVATLDTRNGEVVVGAMICYDREFPESARALMLAGAELILTPNACDIEINRLSQFRARAFENMVAVAMANYAGPWMGHSVAYDGIAFTDDDSRDMLVVEAGEREGIYPAVFDLDALAEYRGQEIHGDSFRRPSAYGSLVYPAVREPFVRVDRDGRLPRR
ncbi:carbon-nitrogen hydrolase family protein [Actinocrispum wychmicini]|nr:carbon-nitrogen hydrolase family protein [Actinocrispum wychmicini]